MTEEPLIKCVGIHKNFGLVTALDGVDFEVGPRESVGLVGDNGAVKSTLIKIISGVYGPSKGDMYYKGESVEFNSPKEAMEAGIEKIHQEVALIDGMSIMRNFFLGREPKNKLGLLKRDLMERETSEALSEMGLEIRSPLVNVEQLSGGQRQGIGIARALHFESDIVALDEPTNNLSVAESEKVYRYVNRLKEEGVSTILISHAIRNVYPAVDKIVVLENGEKKGEFLQEETTIEGIEDIVRTAAA